MKAVLLSLLLTIASSNSFAQLREGFDTDEVKAMIALCNSYTFLDLYGSDVQIIPTGYTKVFSSETMAMDNKFQVYEKGDIGVLNFRGSTDQISSWVENMYSAMIPAQGVIKLDGKNYPYSFAQDTSAGVHTGYALAVVLMSPVILEQIQKLNKKGIFSILLTGHSQGGALVNLLRAYLENLPKGTLSSQNTFKTYAFANPMCGNKEFAEEFALRYGEINMSYSIINPADLVPMMPMNYQEEGKILSKDRIKDILFGRETLDIRKLGMDLVLRKFEKNLVQHVQSSNKMIEKMISKIYGSIELPPYLNTINYFQVGNIRTIEAFEYPLIKLDPSTLTEKQLEKAKPAPDGNYYKQEPMFFQHKPYNYYVEILKEFHSRDYKNLEVKYLSENL